MSNSFTEIFRPKKPNQLIGESQIATATALLKRVNDNEILQEILFSGPSGIGKTTIAKMYIQELLGQDIDLDSTIVEMNCASETGIDHIRTIKDSMQYLPMSLSYRVFYLDEIHGLSRQAQNALLKEIEPVPEHVIFISSTTDPDKLIPTLRSRFTEYRLEVPSIAEFKKLAGWIQVALSKNGHKPDKSLDFETLTEIISLSNGNVRDFDRKIQQFYEGTFKGWKELIEDEKSLIHQIMWGKPVENWFEAAEQISDIRNEIGRMCGYARTVLKNKSSKPQSKLRAMKVIKIFGDKDIFEIIPLYKKLIMLYEELN